MYSFRAVPAVIFTEGVQQSDDSIGDFSADTLCFPENYRDKTVNAQCYLKALNQLIQRCHGMRDGGFVCYRKLPMIDAAQYSAHADTMHWCQKYSIVMVWSSAPAGYLLQDTFGLFVMNLRQWELPVAYECPSAEIQNKSALPLQRPSPKCIPHRQSHLFSTQGDFARQIKSKLKSTFIADLSEDGKRDFTSSPISQTPQ